MEPAVSITNYQLISVQTIISNAEFPNLDIQLVNNAFFFNYKMGIFVVFFMKVFLRYSFYI